MRTRRLVAVWSAVATAVLAVPAGAAVTPSRARLAGTTTIQGSVASYVDVTLPRKGSVRTPFDSSPDISITGEGRFVVVVLAGTDAATRSTTLVGGRLLGAGSLSQFLLPVPPYPAPGAGSYENIKGHPDVTTLPAGNYRLYLLADGKPVRVSLRLGGLAGTATLAPPRRASYQVTWPAARPLGGNGTTKNVYSGGASYRLGSPGLLFHGLRLDTSAYAAAQVTLCHRPGAALAEPVDAGPGCPFAERTIVNDRLPTAAADAKLFLQGFTPMTGDHGLGVWYATESVVTDVQYVTFALTY